MHEGDFWKQVGCHQRGAVCDDPVGHGRASMKTNSSRRDGRIRPSSRAKRGGLLSALSRLASVSRAILREIFDESAYERFLDRRRLESSPNAYAIFRQENEQAKSRRPRCC